MGRNIEISNNLVRRRLLEQSSNLLAAPATGGFSSQPILAIPIVRSSGTFPAIQNATESASNAPSPMAPPDDTPSEGTNPIYSSGTTTNQPSPAASNGNTWIYFLVIPIVAIVIIVAAGLLFMCRKKGVTTIGPWKTGLSGQLQKAFVTGEFRMYMLQVILKFLKIVV